MEEDSVLQFSVETYGDVPDQVREGLGERYNPDLLYRAVDAEISDVLRYGTDRTDVLLIQAPLGIKNEQDGIWAAREEALGSAHPMDDPLEIPGVNLLLVYKSDHFETVPHHDSGYAFKDPSRKLDALVAVIEIE